MSDSTASIPAIALIGAGFISSVHAEALRSLGRPIAAVVDPHRSAAERLARRWNIPDVFSSMDEALERRSFGRAHVLVPPDLHHTAGIQLLKGGVSVLAEKPVATSLEAADELLLASSGLALGVNQNAVFHPAFVRMRAALRDRVLGQPQFVSIIFHAPLRQLSARQFGHWMFREPGNILLEQAVHPLSQLVALCGPATDINTQAGPTLRITPKTEFFPSFSAILRCRDLPASIRFAVGQNFPFWQVLVTCDDGVLVADIAGNRFWTLGRTRWPDAMDAALSGQRTSLQMLRDSWKGAVDFALSTVRLKQRSDAFYQSMRSSIGAFHDALDRNSAPPLDGDFGRELVRICKCIEAQFGPARSKPSASSSPVGTTPDVAVLGGTGFIGAALVARLRAAGLTVAVMARNTGNLGAVFQEPEVVVHRGDIRRADDVGRAISGAKCVVNLAHGGGGETWEQIRNAMVGGAEIVAKACQAAGIERLVHVGSIAGLYLGSESDTVTGATPVDPRYLERADYARAKAMSDALLLDMNRTQGLPVCILRPGLVVGEGTSPFHSGLGFYNNEQHCIGWNKGRNPLPFVLVEDVADAIFAALSAKDAIGRCYNLAGDVRMTASEYTAELARALKRPLAFHSTSPHVLFASELGKWMLKRIGGRKVALPSMRDILSRGLKAHLDCSDAKRDLNWTPVADREAFITRAILVHAPTG